MSRVLFESLMAPSIPSRLSEIASMSSSSQGKGKKPPSHHSISEIDVHDAVTQAEKTLGKIGEMMTAAWGQGEVETAVRNHHFYVGSHHVIG